MNTLTSRRTVIFSTLKGLAGLGCTAVFSSLGISCKKASESSTPKSAQVLAKEVEVTANCPNQEKIPDSDKSIRAALKYVDQTPIKDRTCDNCKLYTLPIDAAQSCGGCKVVPGPIHPKGYCTAWLARM